MNVVKVRRVGNSNVLSIPRELEGRGFAPGTDVIVEEVGNGELRILPAERVRELIRAAGRKVIQQDRKALRILADYDQGKLRSRSAKARTR